MNNPKVENGHGKSEDSPMRGIPSNGVPMPGWEKDTEINIPEALSTIRGASEKHKPTPEVRYPCVMSFNFRSKSFLIYKDANICLIYVSILCVRDSSQN